MYSLREKDFETISNILCLTNDDLDAGQLNKMATMVRRYDHDVMKDNGLDVLIELLSLSKEDLDLFRISQVASIIKRYQTENLGGAGVDFFLETLRIAEKDIDLEFFSKVLAVIRDSDLNRGVEDSLSLNQFKSKRSLMKAVEKYVPLGPESRVVIWGCWYGSILIPYFRKRVGKVVGIDQDAEVIRFAKNKFYYDYPNVDLIADDIFDTHRNIYLKTDLIINTSCEHMRPMKEWEWFKHGAIETDKDEPPAKPTYFKTPVLGKNVHFAFQSNNMFGIEGHINCVNSIDAFKDQLPERAEVFFEEEIQDDRGTRYMLVGKFM